MNANLELALITRVIDEKDFRTLEKAKVDEAFFYVPEAREGYRFLRDMYHTPSTAGEVPSREFFRMHFPTFPYFESRDSVAILAEQLRRDKITVDVEELAQTLLNQARLDPIGALSTLSSTTPRLSALAERSEDYSMSAALNMLRQRYDMVSTAKGLLGIPYPWTPLNEATQGMKPQNFIVLYGRPKSMKTWVALKIAVNAYTKARRRVLFYSREMAPEELLGRAASIIAEVDYNEFLNGRLQPGARDHLFQVLAELADDEQTAGAFSSGRPPYFIVVSDRDSPDGGGVSWLQAKIEELDPDIAFVDGMYLMKDDRTKSRTIDWKNITHISQDTKLTARRFEIPIIGITQANRGAERASGEDLTELAFADALGMDADAVFRVKSQLTVDPNTKRDVAHLLITAPGLRDGIFHGMVLRAEPGHTFDLMKTLTGADRQERIAHGAGNYSEHTKPTQQGPPGQKDRPRVTAPNAFTRNGVVRGPPFQR